MKNGVFWDVTSCGFCKNRRFEETSAFIIRVTRIGELGTTANVVYISPILVTLMMEALVPPKRRFLQEPHGVTSQKTSFLWKDGFLQ
jgi:hypothetical protein